MVEGLAPKQALAIETAGGLVVVTGCVRLLLGGFHMLTDPSARAAVPPGVR